MAPFDASSASTPELLRTYAEVHEALRRRGLMRSTNAPTGDYAAYLFCKAFGWEQSIDGTLGFDAKDSRGTLYLIRGKRITRHSSSRELPAIQDLANRPFATLAAVLFREEFTVLRAALVPVDVVTANASYSEHARSWRFLLTDGIWAAPGVSDVTVDLQKVAHEESGP